MRRSLHGSKGSDPDNMALARLLWERTTVSQAWAAERLQMGSAANVSQQLRRAKPGAQAPPPELKKFFETCQNLTQPI